MDNGYKRGKLILILGIVSLGFALICIPLLIVFLSINNLLYFVYSSPWVDPTIEWNFTWSTESIILITFGLIAAVTCTIISVVASVMILASQFNNKSLDDLRIIMGILSFILIGPVGAVIFGGIVMNKLKSSSANTQNDDASKISEPVI